jgi:hypothetical protein
MINEKQLTEISNVTANLSQLALFAERVLTDEAIVSIKKTEGWYNELHYAYVLVGNGLTQERLEKMSDICLEIQHHLNQCDLHNTCKKYINLEEAAYDIGTHVYGIFNDEAYEMEWGKLGK